MKDENQALFSAVYANDVDGVKTAVVAGADVNTHDAYDWPVLANAAVQGCIKIVRVLLADDTVVAGDRNFALRGAAGSGKTEVVRLLLVAGAEDCADAADVLKLTGLALATTCGHIEVVRILLAARNVYANSTMRDVLCGAARNDHTEITRCLLAAGVDVHANHNEALHHAVGRGYVQTARVLLTYGVDAMAVLRATPRGERRNIASVLEACARCHVAYSTTHAGRGIDPVSWFACSCVLGVPASAHDALKRC